MNQTLKTELKLFLADTLVQIAGYRREGTIYKLLSLDTRDRHILRERRRVTKTLWVSVLRHYDWSCARCGVRNLGNKQWGRPKIEVDHVKSLYEGGTSDWRNLQLLCGPHNRVKGATTVDYRRGGLGIF